MAQSYVLPREGGVDIRFRNIFGLVLGIWKAHGVYGFYHGLLANSMKIVPQMVVFWMVFASGQMAMTGGSSSRKATA
uniref:Uncharacterized protein n=1 Tax=Plectus sambesii TaxID=2011161 RepID=A0A914VHH2_9BILA